MHMSQEDLHSKINDIDEVYQNYANLKNNNGRLQRKYYRSLLSLKAVRKECQLYKDSHVTTDQYESLVKERDELRLEMLNTKNEFNSFVNDSHIRYQSSCREVGDLNSKYNDLLTKYEELKNENKVVSELCSNSTVNDEEIHDLQILFNDKCQEVQVLQEKVTNFVGLQTKFTEMQAKNDDIAKERDRLDLKVQTLELELQQVMERNRNRYATLESEHNGIVKKTLNLEDRCKNLTVERDHLQNQLNDLRKRLHNSQDPLKSLLVTLRGVVETYDNDVGNDRSSKVDSVKFPTDDCDIGNVQEKCTVLHIPEYENSKNEGMFDDCKLIQESDFIDDAELLKMITESTKRFKLISPISSPLHEKEDCIFDFENENAIQSELSLKDLNCDIIDENENKNIIYTGGNIESTKEKSLHTLCVESASCTEGNNEVQNDEMSTGGVADESFKEANLSLGLLSSKSTATPTEPLKDSSEDLVKYVDHLSNEFSLPVCNGDALISKINVNTNTLTDSEQNVITCFSNIDGEITKDLNELSFTCGGSILENCAKINFDINERKSHELKLLNTKNTLDFAEKKHCNVNTVNINEHNNGQTYFYNKLGGSTCNSEYRKLESKKECDNRIVTNFTKDTVHMHSTSNICKFETPNCIDKEEIVEVFNNKLKSVDSLSELKVGNMSESSSGFSPKVSQCESTDSAFVSNSSSSSEEEDWINSLIDDTKMNACESFSKASPKLLKLSKNRTSNIIRRKKKINNEFTLGFEDNKIVTIISKSKHKPGISRKADLLKKCSKINKISNKSIAKVTNSRKERQKHNQEKIIIEQLPCVSCARYNCLTKNRKRSFSQNICESACTVVDEDPQVYAKRRLIAHTPPNPGTPKNLDSHKNEDGKINIISVHVIKPAQAVNSEEKMLSKVTSPTIQKSESVISPASPVLIEQENWVDLPAVIPTEVTTMTCTNVREDRIISKLISPTIRESQSVSSPASPVFIEHGNQIDLPVVIPTEIAVGHNINLVKPVNQENNIHSKLISPLIHKSEFVLYKLTEQKNDMNIPPVIPSEILKIGTDYVTKPMKAVNEESETISASGAIQERKSVNSEETILSKVTSPTIQKSEPVISPVLIEQENWVDLPAVIPTEVTTMTCTNVREDRIISKLISPTIRESQSVSSPASPVFIEHGNQIDLPVVIPTEIAVGHNINPVKPVNQENNIQSKLISPMIHKSEFVPYKLTEQKNDMNIPPVIPSEILKIGTDHVTKPMKAVNEESETISALGTIQERKSITSPKLKIQMNIPPAVPTQKGKMTVEKGRTLIKEMLQFCKCNEKIFEIAKLFVHQSADFIVKLILEDVVFDIHDTPTRGYYPREPHLTTVQRGLYKFIMALEKLNVKGVSKAYFGQADLYIRTLEDPVTLSPVLRLYVALCKGQFNYRQMRMAICSAFADMGDLVLPYVYIVLQMWIEVFPRKDMPAHGHILMRTIVQIILLKNVSMPEYNLVNLRYLLINYYRYSNDCEDVRLLLKELLKYYIDERNECARVLAIALLKHVNVKLMVEEIFPALHVQGTTLSDTSQVCAVITLVMHFTKHSELSPEIIASNLEWLKQFGSDLQPFIVKNHANAVLQWYMKCNSCPFNILEAG